MRQETHCRHMGYSFRLAARVLLYALSYRQDSTYHGLCCTSHGALAGTRNSSMGPPWLIDPTTHHTMSKGTYHGAKSRSKWRRKTSINIKESSHRQDSTYHGLYEKLVGIRIRNSSMGLSGTDLIHCTMNKRSTTELSPLPHFKINLICRWAK